MQLTPSSASDARSGIWRKIAALLLVVAVLGLPINDLIRFGLLLLTAVVIFSGPISAGWRNWCGALAVVVAAGVACYAISFERIEEGHNVFLPGGGDNALVAGLPMDAFAQMSAEFDRVYPPERRCDSKIPGCWQGQGRPDRAYAFSADGVLDKPRYSRRIGTIGFVDPVWLGLGFINDARYNWNSATSELHRNERERSWQRFLHPWRIGIPYFVMYVLPAHYLGSALCWQGLVLWEQAGEKFAALRNDAMACRVVAEGDIGRRIFGIAIGPDAKLAMRLDLGVSLFWRQMATVLVEAIGAALVLLLLVRWQARSLAFPFALVGLSLLVVLLNDASFIGGLRPFDGGDDGLFYDGVGRRILQHLRQGDIAAAFEGGEKVYYYGGPGLRYFRALEHVLFGETYLGYLALVLVLPFVVRAVFAQFLSARTAVALTLIFVAVPIGALFGTSLFHYVKWAARGFADPAAAIFFLAGLVVLIGRRPNGPGARFAPAFYAGLLFALALWVRPNLAPGAAVLLGGAGLAALWRRQFVRVIGMCIGFAPVFGMALHNWYFGGAFVLFSANAAIAEAVPMPPSAYVAAFQELLRLDFAGEHVRRGILQIARWLAGPSESFLMVPLHALAIIVLLRVGFARAYDPWLRLIAWATLALHAVPLFYLSADRYYYLNWFLTLLVCAVWAREEGFSLVRRWWPGLAEWIECHPVRARFERILDRWVAPATSVSGTN